MNLPDNLLSDAWYWAAWLLWLPIFAHALWRAEWSRLKDSELLNVWLGMVVLLVVVWSMKAGVRPGLTLHLLGASLFTLCFGPHLALVGLSLVQLGLVLNGAADLQAYALNLLLLGALGVGLAQAFTRLVDKRLPPHFFVYIFVNGFFGAALVVLGIGLGSTLLLGLAEAYEPAYLLTEYLPYFLLLAFSEAWLSGMLLTLFVVYRPKWVSSFDDTRYLIGK